MTAAQLRLLLILALELIANTIQQLHIALLRVLLERRDESPRHGTRRLASDIRILGGLGILAAGPHDDIGRRSLGLLVALIGGVASCGLLEQAHGGIGNASHVAASVGGDDAEQSLTGLFGEVGFLEDALGGVDVWEIEGGAGMAGVEDGGQADTRLERPDEDAVHLVVDNVAGHAEIDGVDDLVIAIFFIAVEIFGLTAVT